MGYHKMMKDQDSRINYSSLVDLFGHFPYLNASSQFFPIYAYLIAAGTITSPWAILMMVPFVFITAAGYAYNNLAERHNPHSKKNPVADGLITPVQARWIIIGCIAISIITFWLLYRAPVAWISFLLYVILILAYNGLGLRLKESLLGPFVAAYLWTAGVLILALEFNIMASVTILSFILAIYLIYVSREIYQTIIDLEIDEQAGKYTFAVRTTPRTQLTVLVIAVSSGAFCLIWSIYAYFGSRLPGGSSSILTIIFILIIILGMVMEIYYCTRHKGPHPSSAFYMLRTSFILYAALIMNLPVMFVVLLIWAYLIDLRS